MTTTSVPFNSATKLSDNANNDFCASDCGSPRVAAAASPVKYGNGCATRSRVVTLALNLETK